MEQGKIVNGFYVQGDLKFAVDSTDAHKTFDAVAALSQPDKVKLAKLNDIPAEPYNKQLLTTILKSVVQNAWFANKLGNVPTEVATAHAGRVASYKAQLTVPTSAVDFLSRKTRAASKTKPSLLFTIDQTKFDADYNNWRGQRYLVGNTMIQLGKTTGITVREIFENTKETRETTQPTRNAVGQIVNKLVEAGIASCLNPQDAKAKPTPTKTKAAPPAVAKKKH